MPVVNGVNLTDAQAAAYNAYPDSQKTAYLANLSKQQTGATPSPGGVASSSGPMPGGGAYSQTTPGLVTTPSYAVGIQGGPGPFGTETKVSLPAYEQQQQSILNANLANQQFQQQQAAAQQAFQQRMGVMQNMAGSAPGQVQYGGQIADQEKAAQAAQFARAKELAGQNALAALQSFQGAMADRGLTGSTGPTLESGGIERILGSAAGGVQDVIREQMLAGLQRAAQIADMQYQGGITQRGQDISRQQALLSLINSGTLY